jgi:hypothetical protein
LYAHINNKRKNNHEKRVGGMAQGVGPDFKPWYHTHTQKDKWDCIELKTFCTKKETINRVKR